MTSPNDLAIEEVPIESLTPDPSNARLHNEANLKAITHSLDLFGQVKPLVVSADGTIYAGNGTYQAAQALGWKKLKVVRMPADWTPAKAMAYALMDNRTGELAEWDGPVLASQLLDLDALGWEIKDLGFDNLPELEAKATASADVPPRDERSLTCPRCGFEFQDTKGAQA